MIFFFSYMSINIKDIHKTAKKIKTLDFYGII